MSKTNGRKPAMLLLTISFFSNLVTLNERLMAARVPLNSDTYLTLVIELTKVNSTADCVTGHKLLACRCSIVARKKRKKTKPPTILDNTMNTENRERLERFLDEQLQDICEGSWEDYRKVLQNATKQTFDNKKRRSQDWFEDHDEKIQSLLKNNKLNGDRTVLREEIRKLVPTKGRRSREVCKGEKSQGVLCNDQCCLRPKTKKPPLREF